MLEICADISIRRQSELLNIPRTKFYYKPIISDESEIINLIREIYLLSDCRYGYRKITADLHNQGKIINAKKVLRIMQEMEIEGLYPKSYRNTTIKNLEHKIYPYLLGLVLRIVYGTAKLRSLNWEIFYIFLIYFLSFQQR